MKQKDLKKALDHIADLINDLSEDLKAEFGEGANLYFEAGGNVYAMKPEPREFAHGNPSTAERQSLIIARSEGCDFDCGAW